MRHDSTIIWSLKNFSFKSLKGWKVISQQHHQPNENGQFESYKQVDAYKLYSPSPFSNYQLSLFFMTIRQAVFCLIYDELKGKIDLNLLDVLCKNGGNFKMFYMPIKQLVNRIRERGEEHFYVLGLLVNFVEIHKLLSPSNNLCVIMQG